MSKLFVGASAVLVLLTAGAADHPYGGIRLSGTFDVEGVGRVTDATIWAESYPTQYHVKAVLEDGQHLYSYTVSADAQGVRFPQMDESIWLMPPLTADNVLTAGVELATAQLYVAPNGTNADGFGGSSLTPYQTLAYAVSKASSAAKARTVIHAAAGDYTLGSASSDGQTAARVNIDRSVRIKGAGRGKSVIWGEKDTTSGTADAYGCGPNAVRCVRFATFDKTCVQGFTLRDGYSGLSTDTAERKKGGIVCKGVANMICDCLVTNCFGYNGAASYCGSFIRSIVTCNDGIANQNAITANNTAGALLVSSFVRNRSTGGSTYAVYSATAHQCTIVGDRFDPTKDGSYGIQGSTRARNCAIGQANRSLNLSQHVDGNVVANVIWDAGCVDPVYFVDNIRFGSGHSPENPYLYRLEADDGRPASLSPVIGAGIVDADYYKTYSADVNGDPILFVNGRPTVGAVQTLVKTLVVPKDAGVNATLTVTGVANLTNAVDTGDSVTLTLTDAKRPGGSFVVNGETVQGPTYTVVVGDATPDPLLITNVTFTSDWYVDAVNGDDANSGFYPGKGHAKQTLVGALTNKAVKAHDIVHAAAGTYDKGTVFESSSYLRCVVGEDITLIADEGPEKTVILGEAAKTDPDAEGCGADAVRCASTYKNARLSGFTLTGGRVPTNVSGGAALQNPAGTIENCIITNNASYVYAGAVQGGLLVNCRIFDNRSANNDSIVRGSYGMYGCVVDKNYANQICNDCSFMYGCTIGSNNMNYARTATAWSIYYPGANNVFANCIIMGNYNTSAGREFKAYNSVFAHCYNSQVNPAIVTMYGNSFYTNAADIVLSDSYAPTAKDSFLVDAGDGTQVDDAKFRGKDALGGQRVYNGAVDIGATEYDWRGDYTADLVRKSDCTVTAATTNVVEAGTSVKVPPAGELTLRLELSSDTPKGRLSVSASVSGSGSLQIYLNGKLVGTRTAASEPSFELKTQTVDNEIVFKYVGADGYALLGDIAELFRGFLLQIL